MTDNKFNRRTFIQGGVALAASAAAWPGRAQGRAFPTKPLTLIVPFAPGGNVDITARTAAQRDGGPAGGAAGV